MTKMDEEDIEKLFVSHPHLKKYVDALEDRISTPTFYTKLPFEVKFYCYHNI